MTQYEPRDPELAYGAADQEFNSGTESRGDRSPEEIEREIEQTRSRMSRNIDELGDRLSPSNLKEEAKSAIKDAAQGAVSNVGEQARRTSSRLVEVIRENPPSCDRGWRRRHLVADPAFEERCLGRPDGSVLVHWSRASPGSRNQEPGRKCNERNEGVSE